MGYYLYYQKCAPCTITQTGCCAFFIPNCVTCNTTTVCGQCMTGYYLVANAPVNLTCLNCSLVLNNCLNCNTPFSCLLCDTGYALSNNLCVPCNSSILNCAICLNLTSCLTCSLPYLAVNGTCYNCPIWPLQQLFYLDSTFTCHSCTTVTNNCIRCTTSLICTLCIDLYYLDNNICHLCSTAINNCLACKNKLSCSICANGYYLNNSGVC